MKSYVELTPDEVLSMAIGVEGTNATRYSIWADRLRNHNPEVAALFDELAEEEKLYQRRLTDIFVERYGDKKVDVDPDRIKKVIRDSNLDLDHFLVVDDKSSKKILLEALKAEFETFVFFKQALLSTKDTRLMKIYDMIANFEEQHVEELKSSLDADEARATEVTDMNAVESA